MEGLHVDMSLTHAIPATPDHVKRQIDKMDKIHAEATLNMPLCPGAVQ